MVEIAAGRNSTLVRFSDGRARAWGNNTNGELGQGVLGGSKASPSLIEELSGVAQIAARFDHSCALGKDGLVKCWGRNDQGQVGGEGEQVAIPRVVVGLQDVAQVAVGERHSCARLKDGRVLCWGDGGHGQLGQGEKTNSQVPVEVKGVAGAKQLSLMAARSCALIATGVVCWGFAAAQEPGSGADDVLQATAIPGTQDAEVVAAGGYFGCFLGFGVGCWGANESKQLGEAAPSFEVGAKPVEGLSGPIQVGLGLKHSCAALDNGLVKCWGENGEGQIGKVGDATVLPPATVPGVIEVSAVAAGEAHSCALRSANRVSCWGRNQQGQLGLGTTGAPSGPVEVVWLPRDQGQHTPEGHKR